MIESALEPLFISDASLDRAVRHALFGNAKRIRASLALIAAEAAGGVVRDALPIAVAFELLHTASLIHDDIMDGASMRRGRSCVHRVFGTDLAITAGDALIFEAYRALIELFTRHPLAVAERVTAIFTSCAAKACRGQALDLGFKGDARSMRQYLTMVNAKTGSMIEAPLECAAVLAGAPRSWCDGFRDYGRSLGIAFQVTDDVTDYLGSEEKGGKTLGNDVRNGAGSAMLIYARHACSPAQHEVLADAIRQARTSHAGDGIASLVAMMEDHGAIEWTQRLCARYADRALRALEDIGVEPARSELAAIATIVGRWKVSRPPFTEGDKHEARHALVH
ncbi:MAG TPA: polyprenyl synthetase family protein [Casimicrobiaceae bacterium]|nr:polyprenyl synthetase family protein [Casimicrobiaceae bacterium]